MKRIKYLLLIIPIIILLASCGKSNLREERIIELSVETDVVPEFSATFGEGNYEESTKLYTHRISYIKDLSIYLSYENLKTVQVDIKTEEMKEKIIRKNVKFGNELDAKASITVKGVSDLSNANFIMDGATDIVKNKKNIEFVLPSRTRDYNGKISIENYQDIDVNISSNELKTGLYENDYVAVSNDKIYIKLINNCNCQIYDYETCSYIKDAYNSQYGDNQTSSYVILPNDKEYFVVYDNMTKVAKLNKGENYIINGKYDNYDSQFSNNNYYYFDSDYSTFNPVCYFYDKKNNTIFSMNDNRPIDNIDNYGLIYSDSSNYDTFYYYEDAKLRLYKNENRSTDSYFYMIKDHDGTGMLIDSYDLDVKNIFNDDDIDLGTTTFDSILNILFSTNAKVYFENGVLKSSFKTYPETCIYINFYDKETNELVYKAQEYIGQYTTENFRTVRFNYNGRSIQTGYIFYNGDVKYDRVTDSYSYRDIYLTINTSLIRILSNDIYDYNVFDENGEIVEPVVDGGNNYYNLSANKKYIVSEKYGDKSFEITPTEDDIKSGFIIIGSNIQFYEIDLPSDVEVEGQNDTLIKIMNGKKYYGNISGFNNYSLKYYYKDNPDNYRYVYVDEAFECDEYIIKNVPDLGFENDNNYVSCYDSETRILKSIVPRSSTNKLYYNATDGNYEQISIYLVDGVYEYQFDYKIINLPENMEHQIISSSKNYYIWEQIGSKNIITRIDSSVSNLGFRLTYPGGVYSTIYEFDNLTDDYFIEYHIVLSDVVSQASIIGSADVCHKYDANTKTLTMLCPKTKTSVNVKYEKDSTYTTKTISFVEGETTYNLTI